MQDHKHGPTADQLDLGPEFTRDPGPIVEWRPSLSGVPVSFTAARVRWAHFARQCLLTYMEDRRYG